MSKNELVLKKDVKIKCFDVMADIAIETSRKDIIPILKLAEENGGMLDGKTVVENFLPGSPLVMGDNLVKRYTDRGYLDEEGNLTKMAKNVLEKGVPLIPEHGPFRVWATDDSIYDDCILTLERVEENIKSDEDKSDELPGWIFETQGESITLFNIHGKSKNDHIHFVHINTIEGIGEPKDESPSKMKAIFKISQDYTKLNFRIGNNDFPYNHQHDLKLTDVWEQIKIKNKLDWRGKPLDKGYLEVKFEDLNQKEKINFTKKIKVKELYTHIGDYDVEPLDVNIQPKRYEDAKKWYLSLLKDKINKYLPAEQYTKVCEEIKSKFESHEIKDEDIPDQEELAQKFKKSDQTREFWYLQAPIDLVPEEVD